MVRLKHKPTPPPQPPERGVKAATFRLLLDTAMDLIKVDGHVPSVAEVATRSKVSRATAYRYFPSRGALVTAVVDASLGPVRHHTWRPDTAIDERLLLLSPVAVSIATGSVITTAACSSPPPELDLARSRARDERQPDRTNSDTLLVNAGTPGIGFEIASIR